MISQVIAFQIIPMQVFSILFPVVAIVLLGYFYAKRFKPDMDVANGLVLRVFVPALAFDVISGGDFEVLTYRWLIAGCVIVVLGSGLIAWAVGKFLNYPLRAFLPSMMFNNCGNLGLPLAVLAFGEEGLAAAVILFLVSNLGHFTLGVYIFGGVVSWKGLLSNPVNIATFLALVFNFTGVQLPEMIQFPISMLGDVVIPLMLFSLGVRMNSTKIEHLKIGVVGGLVCPASGLIFAFIAVAILPLTDLQVASLLLFSAMPPAVLNFLMSEQYRQQPEIVASLVLIGNAMAVLIMSGVLWWLL